MAPKGRKYQPFGRIGASVSGSANCPPTYLLSLPGKECGNSFDLSLPLPIQLQSYIRWGERRLRHTPHTLHLENTQHYSYSFPEAAVSRVMNLLLRLIFLSLLCLHAQGWALKRPTQNEQWKVLDWPQNRELFLSALQSYLSTKGIQVERTAPAFVLASKDHNNMGTHRAQEEQELVVLEPGMSE